MIRRPSNRAALKRRLTSRAARQQVAMEAEVTDRALLERLGVTWGTASDGRIIMSKGDWTLCAANGGIRFTNGGRAIKPATE